MNGTQQRSLRTKKLVKNLQKDDKDSRVSVTCRSWVCSVVFDNGEFYKFRVCRHGNAVWGCGWELKLGPRIVDRTLSKRQWYSISEIMVPLSLKPTSVAVVGPNSLFYSYCRRKNTFWNASKKSPRSALADLQLKLAFRSL
ncbi:hypothetical protein Zmor_021506 [Zophobas morio]|uniref:Uncharacterized protein n=1 Tax=Zophobas morio TaxID=2755281 RepID=A0AA38I2W3_9CUCU|nr:hypothetical protein Zmor_021506 [Zophobas morio]